MKNDLRAEIKDKPKDVSLISFTRINYFQKLLSMVKYRKTSKRIEAGGKMVSIQEIRLK